MTWNVSSVRSVPLELFTLFRRLVRGQMVINDLVDVYCTLQK